MKTCFNCGAELDGRYTTKFCSHSCSALYNNRKRKKIIRYCVNCNKKLKTYQKKFCSNRCQCDYQYSTIKELILTDNVDQLTARNKDAIVKKVLLEIYGNKCMQCGWNEINKYTNKVPVQLEHRDGHWYNFKLDNLELLCPNCHSLTKTFGGANRGNGRPHRYKNKFASIA